MRLPVILLLGAALSGCGEASARSLPETGDAVQPSANDPRVAKADMARIDGKPTAGVWILMISDFQCPYCKEFHDVTAAKLRKEFVDKGQARLAYLNFPLRIHPNAIPAAEAAMCGGAQDKFWPMHDLVFASQKEWAATTNPLPIFGRLAKEAGLDTAAWNSCMKDHVMLPMIQADYQRGASAGVKSTPTFLVGDVKLEGNAPIEAFRQAMKQATTKTK